MGEVGQNFLFVAFSLIYAISRAQNDAAVAAAMEKTSSNNDAASGQAAQLLQGGMAGLAGLQNPLQMNQLVSYLKKGT